MSTFARLLHVANGTSTTHGLRAAGVSGAFSIWADVLYEGPVPDLPDEELLEIRRRFLAADAGPTADAWVGNDPTLDPVNDLREWRRTIAHYASYDELVLWFEHDLFDQLNLIQLLTWIKAQLPATVPVTLVCIGSFPGRPNFKGLGELRPEELGPLLDTRQPVTQAQYALASRAWDAFRQPTPVALAALIQQETSSLPYLAPALTRFLQEYPWCQDGLSKSERRLLQLASTGGIALIDAFPRMHDAERFYHSTDGSLASMAETLSRLSPPLLTLDRSRPTQGMLRGTVALTDPGRDVLAGRSDRVATCGIDRWLGGVQVTGRGEVWRWDDSMQTVVRR